MYAIPLTNPKFKNLVKKTQSNSPLNISGGGLEEESLWNITGAGDVPGGDPVHPQTGNDALLKYDTFSRRPQIPLPQQQPAATVEPQIETLEGVTLDEETKPKALRPRLAKQTEVPATTDGDTVNYGQGRIIEDGGGENTAPKVVEIMQPLSQGGVNLNPKDEQNPVEQNNAIRPRIVGQSWKDHQKQNRENLINDKNLQNAPENKPNRLVAAVGLGLKALSDSLRAGNSLGTALGAGLGAGGAGAAFPKVFADTQNRNEINQIEVQQQKDFEKQKQELDNDNLKARTENIRADNEFNKENLEARKTQQNQERIDKILAKYQKRSSFDAYKASDAEIAELKSIGVNPRELGSWDRSNPRLQTINGVKFIWDENNRTFKEAGLPIEEEKLLVDYKTQDGSVYRVSAKTAATLRTQFDTLGIKQQFQSAENEKDRAFKLKYQAIDQQFRAEQAAMTRAQQEAREATNDQQKIEAEKRAEASRLKIIEYQQQLEKEIIDYKK